MLWSSKRGERAIALARLLSCDDRAVRHVIHGLNNQLVKPEGSGVRIWPGFLPTQRPWLTPIEPTCLVE
jgi:hypothetical protein